MGINLDIGKIAGGLLGGGADALGGAAGALGGITKALDPLGSVVDTLGSALGLPPAVTNAAKLGIGIASGNPMMMANGALGIVQDMAKEVPAMTEMYDGHLSAGIDKCGNGYVKGDFKGPGGSLGFDIHSNPLLSPFSSHASFFLKIGLGHGNKPSAPPGVSHPPPPHQSSPVEGGARPPAPGKPPAGSPSEQEYLRALETISHNWGAMIDGSKYTNSTNDWKLDAAELHKLTKHPNPEIAHAANLVLSNPQMRERLFNAHGDGRTITLGEVRSEIHRLRTDMEFGKTPSPESGRIDGSRPPPPPVASGAEGPQTSGKTQGTGKFDSIINDPNLSMEDKIMMILSQIMDEVDDEILETMGQLDKDQAKAAKEKDPNKKAAGDSAAKKTELHLQNLMEKRKRMFDLMTNVSAKFNEMAKAAIQNMARA